MVEINAALRGVEDTASVELEDESIGLDGNRDGASSDCDLELVGVVLDDVGETSARSLDLGGFSGVVLAVLVDGLVRVVSSGHHEEVLGILEALVHPATVATLIAVAAGAVDELLLRQVEEVASLDLPSAFHGGDSREGPA